MATKFWELLTHATRGDLRLSADDLKLPGAQVGSRVLAGGLQEGVQVIEIEAGELRCRVLPQRGMGIWKIWLGDLEVGWQSPVRGPVHPRFVPISEPSGLGWLEGFDELLCRCGLISNGPPEFDSRGVLLHPLHGRIANLPAHTVQLRVNQPAKQLSLTGEVDETRFLIHALRLSSTLTFTVGEPTVHIQDTITNLRAQPQEFELLYHINVGPPILEEGSRLVAPIRKLAPRDARAAEGVDGWDAYAAPQAGFAEQVFYCELNADEEGATAALLKNRAGNRGLTVGMNRKQLPYFIAWKNTGAVEDGYVTGLEPAVNFPNVRSFEKQQGHVRTLGPGESYSCELTLAVHANEAAVTESEKRIAELQRQAAPEICDRPQPGWSPGA